MKLSVVLGLGFGDEGKGHTVSHLVSQSKDPLVIRFNGGQQAGHTVQVNGLRHVFSNFGSGTLQNAPTYWSKFCTVYPKGLMNEYYALVEAGITPRIAIDPLSPVTTPYDIYANRVATTIGYNTCGLGVGTTIKRQEAYFKLYFMDIANPAVFNEKLAMMRDYYYYAIPDSGSRESFKKLCEEYSQAIEDMRTLNVGNDDEIKRRLFRYKNYDTVICEGAQGILLDQDYGFFPFVTRSNTTSKNVFSFIEEHRLENDVDIWYVTRAYQTRHGSGPMSSECPLPLKNNEKETNVTNPYQGSFRIGHLDIDMLRYAMQCDSMEHTSFVTKNLVISCLDQIDYSYQVKLGGNLINTDPEKVNELISTEFDVVERFRGMNT